MPDKHEIIQVPNVLKSKVTYGPDGVDVEALERAEAVIANLRSSYLIWVQEDLIKINACYEQALALPVEARGPSIKAVFGIAHDIKGQGGSFGFQLMTILGNQLCRFTENRTLFGDAELEVIRLHIAAMRMVIGELIEGEGGAAGEDLLRGLQAVIAKLDKVSSAV
ncbi:MAG TPA: phosphorelay protein [Patescibacteria group bacterium]|nr:phosphorelay protein [Patescibacteria group bacterium]